MIERRCAGRVPAKPHTTLRAADGRLLHEQCLTRNGFDGPYTISYHLEAPHTQSATAIGHGWTPPTAVARPLARRHYRTAVAKAAQAPRTAAIDGRVPLLFNEDVVLSVLFPDAPDPVYLSNGDGDDLYYVHAGGGVLRSLLGDLPFAAGDYVFVPRGLLHRFLPEAGLAQHWLSVECLGGLSLPKQWRNETGQLRMDAPYCHRDFRHPTFTGPNDEGIREIVVKRGAAFHAFTTQHAPLDVVGWDGTVYPWAFPILSFAPRVGLVHLPPTWHGTFATRGALICSFVPRPLDFHPQAIPCPYPHASVDCDEFLFYSAGNFSSRRGVGPGSVSHHPAGIPHGPHPGAYEGSIGHKTTDELAVMLDTFRPLHPTAAACRVEDGTEDGTYDNSFMG